MSYLEEPLFVIYDYDTQEFILGPRYGSFESALEALADYFVQLDLKKIDYDPTSFEIYERRWVGSVGAPRTT